MLKSPRNTRIIAPFLLVAIFVALFALTSTSFAQSDRDGDGVPDSSDSCRNRGNEGGLGVDGSGCPYYDADGDGVYDRNDSCRNRGNEYGYGVGGDGCPLTAPPADNTPDAPDNPPADNEPNNPPSDNDEPDNPQPEATDEPFATEEPTYPELDQVRDADGDGMPDSEDECPWRGNEGGLGIDETGCPYYDADWDGFYDRDDSCPWRADEYGYGIDDVGCPCEEEGCGDADNDGVPDAEDLCPGYDDAIDVDGDGIPDGCDDLIDSDDDGVADEEDLCPGYDDAIDVDGDDIPDGCDDEIIIDSDDDGWADEDDCAPLDPAINPGAEEIPGNDVDENCDDVYTIIGSGDISFTLVWTTLTDYDLHVVEPSGEEIAYDNTISATGGKLDLDAYPACNDNVSPNPTAAENIFWPEGAAPDGTYQVFVDTWAVCQGTGEWELTIRVGTQVVDVITGSGDSGAISIDLPYEIEVPGP